MIALPLLVSSMKTGARSPVLFPLAPTPTASTAVSVQPIRPRLDMAMGFAQLTFDRVIEFLARDWLGSSMLGSFVRQMMKAILFQVSTLFAHL